MSKKQHEDVSKVEKAVEKVTKNEANSSGQLIDDAAELQKKNIVLQSKIVSMEEKVTFTDSELLRAYAEMENIRKRAQKDIENAHKFALEKFVKALLPVLDSLEQAVSIPVNVTEDKVTGMIEGIDLTMKIFVDTLNKFGISQINPSAEMFNPNKHEAMAMSPNKDMKDGMIMSVYQKGYELNKRVVRPARVLVVKNKT